MFQKDVVFYLGKEKENGFSGVISEDGFLLVLEIEEGITSEEGRRKLNQLKEYLISADIRHLSDLETLIHDRIQEYNFPANVSLAVGCIKNTVLYLKTIGSGNVYLKRGNQFGKIVCNELSASGRIHEHDIYLFTTDHFIQTIGSEDEIKKIFDHRKPHEIMDEITPRLKSGADEGIIALFAQFNTGGEASVESEEEFVSKAHPWENITSVFQKIYTKTQEYSIQAGPRKKYTFLLVIIISFILIWSVGLGYTRRSEAAVDKKIQTAKNLILQKLNQADDTAFLNIFQSLILISDARQELAKLKKEAGDTRKEIREIDQLITNEENKITKKEEKKYEEFFDLGVDSKEAKGVNVYLDSNNLSVLDKAQGIIYTISLDKKSLDKVQSPKIKTGQRIARYGDSLFLLAADGIYKIDADGKPNKVIDKDTAWGMIVDLWVYNGNIYLLDPAKDQIYKYLVAEKGYSGKTPYFQGSGSGLKNANSLAIDSSVYVGFPDNIFKFTAGSQEDFKTSFPNPHVAITKVFTANEIEKVYAWDKTNGSLYILGKNGAYEREIDSPVLKQTDDFAVYQNKAYLLSGQKIFVMNIE